MEIAKPKTKLSKFFEPIDLTKGSITKVLLTYSLPIFISYFFQQLYAICDSIICGQTLTSDEVAGISDVGPLVYMFTQLAFGCAAGFCVQTSAKYGAGDLRGTRRSFATQLVLGVIMSVLFTGVALLVMNPLLTLLNVTPDHANVYSAARTYCSIIFIGLFAQLFYNLICSVLRSVGDSVTPLIFLFISTILNVALDLLFIKVFHWGVAGAAWATVVTQFLSAVVCLVYSLIKYEELRFKPEDFKVTTTDLLSHVKLGLPLGLQFSVQAIGIIVMLKTVISYDITPLGQMVYLTPAQIGFGAANKTNNLMLIGFNALGTAMISFAAQNVGAGNYERVKQGTKKALMLMFLYYVIAAGFGLLLTIDGTYVKVFVNSESINADTIKYGNFYLFAGAPLYFIYGLVYVLRSAVQGIGKPLYSLATGTAELVGRVSISLFFPVLVNGGSLSSVSSDASFFSLCFSDPGAWLLGFIVLIYPVVKYIILKKYSFIKRSDVVKTSGGYEMAQSNDEDNQG